MYFSGHLLDGFSDALSAEGVTEIRRLLEADEAGDFLLDDRTRVCVAGIITAMTGKTVKSGERMAFFTIEDKTAEIECLVFPRVLERYAGVIRTDAVIRVEGTLSLREDEKPKIILSAASELAENGKLAKKAEPIAEKVAMPDYAEILKKGAKKLFLRVPTLTHPLAHRAKTILDLFDGTLPVSVYDAEKKTYHAQELGFDATPFTLCELALILGPENVVLK